MNDEQNEIVVPDSSVDLSADLSGITEQLEELNSALTEPETIIVDGEEKTQNDLLLEIVQALTPDEEQEQVVQQLQSENFETQMDALRSINENLLLLNTTIENSHTEQIEILEEQKVQNAEGSLMVSLSIVIGLGVYMFWSQLSKW